MQIENILKDEINSILLFIPGENTEIVIGVPHHATQGVQELPCEEHKPSDENAGFVGHALADLLDCPAIIACNYFMDVNKHKSSDYYKRIESLDPKILTEIHGHSRNKARFDIEISSGSLEKNYWSKELAGRLREKFGKEALLQNYTISGDYNSIYFKATRSISITSPAWIAFHIELPRSIRGSRHQYLLFCSLLAEALREILAEFDNLKRS
jgi:Asp-tRNA(Asn)/Glu-tRNA(Gln) amidotransferase A subunit family amidase